MPSCVCCMVPCLLQSHKTLGKQYGPGCVKAKWRLSHSIQQWLLTHPTSAPLVGCCGCALAVANLHDINLLGGSMYRGYHDLYGENFVACGKVLTAEPQVMERYLTGPMQRGNHLHSYYLLDAVLPKASGCPAKAHAKQGKCPFHSGSDAFLLSLDNLGEPDEPHAVLRRIMFDYLLDPAAMARGSKSDPYAMSLLQAFRAEYEKQTAAGEFAWSDRQLPELVLRWFHYALFGLRLDAAAFQTLWLLYLEGNGFPAAGVKYFFWPKGAAGGQQAVPKTTRTMAELRAAAVAMYEASPGLQDYKDDTPLSRTDFCTAMIAIMTLAAIAGPLSAAQGVLRGKWHGEVPKDFVMPAQDRDKLRLVIMESQRLRPSVFGTTCEPLEPFALPIGGKVVHFPAGTPLVLNYRTAGTREAAWSQPKEFRPEARAEQLWGPKSSFWAFNSAGDRTHVDEVTGRICPGRELALTFLIDLLQVLHGAA